MVFVQNRVIGTVDNDVSIPGSATDPARVRPQCLTHDVREVHAWGPRAVTALL